MTIIHFDTIYVDKNLQSIAYTQMPIQANFKLGPEFSYFGNIKIEAKNRLLNFNGYLKIHHACGHRIDSLWITFDTNIDPDSIIIPLTEKSKSKSGKNIFAALFQTNDSVGIYPTFITTKRKSTDKIFFEAKGLLYYNEQTGYFEVTDSSKFVNRKKDGNDRMDFKHIDGGFVYQDSDCICDSEVKGAELVGDSGASIQQMQI